MAVFNYTGTPTSTPVVSGDPKLAAILQDPARFFSTYGANNAGVKGFGDWFNSQFPGGSAVNKSTLWNDIVGDYGSAYSKLTGNDFTPTDKSVYTLLGALSNLKPGGTGGAVGTGGLVNLGGVTWNPVTKSYVRSTAAGTPTDKVETDTFDNLFDYIMKGSLSGGDTKGFMNSANSISNTNGLQSLFSTMGQNRLEDSLNKAYRNLTGNANGIVPADVLAKYTPNSFGYYTGAKSYDTDYNLALQDILGLSSVKGYVDPKYQASLASLKFDDNEESRKNYYNAAAKYGINNVASYNPVTNTGGNTSTDISGGGGVTSNTSGGTGGTTSGGTSGGGTTGNTSSGGTNVTYNFDPSMFGPRVASQGFREGSRYFGEGQNGQYQNNYPNGLGSVFQTTSGDI